MNVAPTLLADLSQSICAAIKIVLPDLETCEPRAGKMSLEELKKSGIKAPAVQIAILGAKQTQGFTGGSFEFPLRIVAYVTTRNNLGLDKDAAAMNICQALLQLVPENNWGEPALGNARDVSVETLVSVKTRDTGVSLWAVSWLQPITFFQEEVPQLGAELYVGQAPDVGAGNVDSYQQVGGAG